MKVTFYRNGEGDDAPVHVRMATDEFNVVDRAASDADKREHAAAWAQFERSEAPPAKPARRRRRNQDDEDE